jgi:hypothetical protein
MNVPVSIVTRWCKARTVEGEKAFIARLQQPKRLAIARQWLR